MGSNLISARKNIVYKHTGGDVVKKKNIIIIALSLLVVLILALLLGHGKNKEKDEKKQTLSQIKTNIESNKNNSDDDNSEITEEDVNTFSDFTDKFAEIEKTKYLNDNGYVDSDDIPALLDEVEKVAEQGVSDGVIDHYTRDDNNIFIVYTSGITNLFIPYQEGTLGGGDPITTIPSLEPTIGGKIITVEPLQHSLINNMFYDIASLHKKNIESKEELYLKENANLIVNNFSDRFEYNNSLTNSEVNIKSVKDLGKYNIIIWEGHGGYNEEIHSALVINEVEPVWNKQKLNFYLNDMKEKRLVTTRVKNQFAITSKFIDKYIDSMQGSLVFLGACSSKKDNELADAFLHKGAYIVFGYTDDVGRPYEMLSRTIFFKELATKKEDNQYQTASEAYENTIKKVGWYNSDCVLAARVAGDGLGERYTLNGLLPESKEQDVQEQETQEETKSSVEESNSGNDNTFTLESLLGDWTLDSDYTMSVNSKSIMYFYGTSFHGSNHKMTFNSDGSFQYYIAWCYGNGTFDLQNNELIVNIDDGDPLQGKQKLIITNDNGVVRIGINQYEDGNYIFWKRP